MQSLCREFSVLCVDIVIILHEFFTEEFGSQYWIHLEVFLLFQYKLCF